MAKKAESSVFEAAIIAESNRDVNKAEKERKALARAFKNQKKVSVSISPLYKPYFGNVMTVTLNGTSVAIPCDGKSYEVPESFAEEIMVRISNQDELIQKQRRMSDVKRNFETSPGELQLF